VRVFCIILLTFYTHLLAGQNIGPEDKVFRIYFGGGSYYIDAEQQDLLEDFFNDIDDLREYHIEIHGHTDSVGSIEFNQYLSKMRCEAAFYVIKAMQIDEELITIHDFGELSPEFSNDTWKGRLSNRRVDVVLKKIVL
jgi:OOP family OmpA-OmpF porin